MRNTYLLGILLNVLLLNAIHAQDNAGLFKNGGAYINSINGQGYFEPLLNVMNNGVHASMFPASDLKDSFYFYIGLNANVAFIPAKQQSFEGATATPFSPTSQAEVPTLFGANESKILEDEDGWSYIFPGGIAANKFYLAMPQVTIGGIAHTCLSLRFAGFSFNEDIGKFKLFGLGIQHDLSPYLPFDQFKLTAEAAYHQFKTGNWMKSNHLMIRSSIIQQSKKAKWYGFFGFQNGAMELIDVAEGVTTKIKAGNHLLIGAGAAVDLAFINLGIEAAYSAVFTLNTSIGFKF